MACANPYEWAKNSDEHRMHTLNYYPLIYELMATSGSYQEFTNRVQGLNPSERNRYDGEYQEWYRDYGRVWDRLGCVPENTLGEHTEAYSFKKPGPTTRPFLTNPLSGLQVLGATVEMPKLPTGYRWCTPPDLGGHPITSERPVAGFFGWSTQTWASRDDRLYYLYKDAMSNEDYWACPPIFTISAVKTEVKKIQSALLAKGFNPGTIDGIWGPATCQAAYSFQRNKLNETGSTLTSRFFFALGVSSLGTKYARSCDKWYTGDLGPDPDYVPAATPLAVKKALLKLGYNPGPMVNVWDRDVCVAAFKFKRTVLGETDAVLGKSFFEKLGLAGTLDVQDCLKYVGAKPAPTPTPTPTPKPVAEAPVDEAAEEAKATFGWIAVMLGAGAIGTVLYKKWKKKGKKKRRR